MVDMSFTCLNQKTGADYSAINGDCVDVLRQMPDRCVDLSVYSPPFSSLFVYSESERDMGNSANDDEFFAHYKFAIGDLLRVTKPGRMSAVHVSDVPYTKWMHGHTETNSFSDAVRAAHQEMGWHFMRRVTIWKCPVTEQGRSHSLNLVYHQLLKDSTKSFPGLCDYLLLFRAPGENAKPVAHTTDDFPLSQWQEWASPVWMDIRQSDTLNVTGTGHPDDERHICPLQMDLIKRAVTMWSNPGETVLSPFMGIGSEGVGAMELKRKFVGIELKPEYWQQACRHLHKIDSQLTLF